MTSDPLPPEEVPELPTLYEAVLTSDVLDALFVDIESLCELEELKVRPQPGAEFSLPPANLDEAKSRLVSQEFSSLQLRYSHDGESWLDTLTPTPVGIRLVRMRDPHLPE